MTASPLPPRTLDPDLEIEVDQAIDTCGGDAWDAVRALIVANKACEVELQALQTEVDAIVSQLSVGYVRGRFGTAR
jgi:hypothetical protein